MREVFFSKYVNNTKEFRSCARPEQYVGETNEPENEKATRQQGGLFFFKGE
jgi:hypothetical protein